MMMIADDPTFDRLPSDVAGLIFGNLPIGDRARMRLVSKSWRDRLARSDFPIKPEPPWRILPIDSFEQPKHLSTELSFQSMSEERTYRFELLTSGRYRWCCCGSSSDGGGWLLMAGRRSGDDLSKTAMILWDPISGTTKRLPALSTLPFFAELVDTCTREGIENISTSMVIAQARVFSVGWVECVVAVVFKQVGDLSLNRHQYRLALCSPQEQSWSVVPNGPGGFFTDMLFHNGKLFTVWAVEDGTGETSVGSVPVVSERSHCTVGLSCCDVEVTMSDLVYEEEGQQQHPLPIGSSSSTSIAKIEHLVGSSAGELLVVCSILDHGYSFKVGGQGLIYQTKGFEVYGLDVVSLNNKGFCWLERLRHVGSQCLFVGASGSTCLTEGVDFGNKIHFATHDADGVFRDNEEQHDNFVEEGIELNQLFVVHEKGVFDMVEDKIERTNLTNLSIQTGSCTGWFTPKLPTVTQRDEGPSVCFLLPALRKFVKVVSLLGRTCLGLARYRAPA